MKKWGKSIIVPCEEENAEFTLEENEEENEDIKVDTGPKEPGGDNPYLS